MEYPTIKMKSEERRNVVFLHISGSKTSSLIGGGLTSQETLAFSLANRGYGVYAITNPADQLGFIFLEDKRFTANYKGNDTDVKTWILFDRRKLKSEIDKIIKYLPENAIFVAVDPYPPDLLAVFHLKTKHSKKTVVTMHHITPSPLFHPFRRGFMRTLIAWSLSVFSLVLVKLLKVPVFLDNLRIADESGWRLDNILMEMPITLKQFIKLEPRAEKFQACYLGRLRDNKGIRDLIQAWRIVVKELPSAHLTLIGNDQSQGKYGKLIEKVGLTDNIRIAGYLRDEEKNNIINNCSLFPFPSYEEGWSLSVMEAIDRGVLPILYDIPAYDYICNSKLKVSPGKVSKFAERIIYFFQHSEERKEIILRLQSCISKYSQDFVLDNWLDQINAHYDL